MNTNNVYEKIYEYCNIQGKAATKNGFAVPKRVRKIEEMLKEANISYTLESFVGRSFNNFYHNIYCKGNSSLCFTAHHDITGASAAANDNSASVINMIALKMNRPDANIVFTDGEEVGGIGAELFAKQLSIGPMPHLQAILNLELTGLGGKRFFIENIEKPSSNNFISNQEWFRSNPEIASALGMNLSEQQSSEQQSSEQINESKSKLTELIMNMPEFDYGTGLPVPQVDAPFNDAFIFRDYNIDSIVINPLPQLLPDGKTRESFPRKKITFSDGTPLDFTIVSRCNGRKDTIDTISTADMKEFVEEVLIPIFDTWQRTYPYLK